MSEGKEDPTPDPRPTTFDETNPDLAGNVWLLDRVK